MNSNVSCLVALLVVVAAALVAAVAEGQPFLVKYKDKDDKGIASSPRLTTVVNKPPQFSDPEYFANSKLSFSYYGGDDELILRISRMYLAWPAQSAWTGFGVAGSSDGMAGAFAIIAEPSGDGNRATFTERAMQSGDGSPMYTGATSLLRSSYVYDPATKTETLELILPWRIGGAAIANNGQSATRMIWALGRAGENALGSHSDSGTFLISAFLVWVKCRISPPCSIPITDTFHLHSICQRWSIQSRRRVAQQQQQELGHRERCQDQGSTHPCPYRVDVSRVAPVFASRYKHRRSRP